MADFFGTGSLIATPLFDASGAAIAIPSPVVIGILQDVTVDDSADMKELYGDKGYPVDIGRGKQKLTLKAKAAMINAELFNSVYYGQGLVAGSANAIIDTVGSTIPTGAGSTAVNVNAVATGGASAIFAADLGVQFPDGTPYTRVASSPTGGQYALVTGVNSSGATYQFSNLDVGKTVFINYQYTNAAGTGSIMTIKNIPMGQVPVFSAQLMTPKRNNQTMWRYFYACTATKLTMDFKNDDFVIPDLEIGCFADPTTGNVQKFAFSE
jgi:hypothetical protein